MPWEGVDSDCVWVEPDLAWNQGLAIPARPGFQGHRQSPAWGGRTIARARKPLVKQPPEPKQSPSWAKEPVD